jgi:hypothetical protein
VWSGSATVGLFRLSLRSIGASSIRRFFFCRKGPGLKDLRRAPDGGTSPGLWLARDISVAFPPRFERRGRSGYTR